ncbi:MAG: hypothetical protein RLZZ488_378 [Pseudomonadota bacterium]|jgi:hypothetical protein
MLTPARTEQTEAPNFRCVSDNVAFVMLSEVLRARSFELTEQLRQPSPDLGVARRLALNMHLSTDNLVQDAGLVSRANDRSLYENQTAEPASLSSVIDLCCIAARHRLREMNISLNVHFPQPSEIFLSGNPWELAYAFFFAIVRSGRYLARTAAASEESRDVLLSVRHEAQFADVSISSPVPLSQFNDSCNSNCKPTSAIDDAEWCCLQKLCIKNDVHVSVQQGESTQTGAFNTVFRLATFSAGHE